MLHSTLTQKVNLHVCLRQGLECIPEYVYKEVVNYFFSYISLPHQYIWAIATQMQMYCAFVSLSFPRGYGYESSRQARALLLVLAETDLQ